MKQQSCHRMMIGKQYHTKKQQWKPKQKRGMQQVLISVIFCFCRISVTVSMMHGYRLWSLYQPLLRDI